MASAEREPIKVWGGGPSGGPGGRAPGGGLGGQAPLKLKSFQLVSVSQISKIWPFWDCRLLCNASTQPKFIENYRILIIAREASEKISTFLNLHLSPPSKGGGGKPPLNHDRGHGRIGPSLDPPVAIIVKLGLLDPLYVVNADRPKLQRNMPSVDVCAHFLKV